MLEQSAAGHRDPQPTSQTHVGLPDEPLAAARELHRQLVSVRRAERGLQHRLAVLLSEMADGGFFRLLGYTSVEQYADQVLEIDFRKARDLLRIGRSLPELPALNEALAAGEVDWTKAREVVRVATPDTDRAWTERAKTESARVIERDVSMARRGEGPTEGKPDPLKKPARTRVTFEMETADAEILRAALAVLRGQSNLNAAEVEDGALLAAMARQVIHQAEPPDSPTGERYQIVLHECVRCREISSPTAEVSDTIAAESACDAVIVDMRPGPKQGHATRAIAPALRRKLEFRAGHACEIPDCSCRLWLDIHHVDGWAQTKAHPPDRLMVVCDAHHRAIHDGNLSVDLGADLRVSVEHADGRRSEGPARTALAAPCRQPDLARI